MLHDKVEGVLCRAVPSEQQGRFECIFQAPAAVIYCVPEQQAGFASLYLVGVPLSPQQGVALPAFLL